jgi:hypothetical protein
MFLAPLSGAALTSQRPAYVRVHSTVAQTAPHIRRWPLRHRPRHPSRRHRRHRRYPRRSDLSRSRRPCPVRIRPPVDLHRRLPSVYTIQHVEVSSTMTTAIGVMNTASLSVRIAIGTGNAAVLLYSHHLPHNYGWLCPYSQKKSHSAYLFRAFALFLRASLRSARSALFLLQP